MTESHRRSLSEERINKRKKTGRRTGRGSQACPRRSPRGKTGGEGAGESGREAMAQGRMAFRGGTVTPAVTWGRRTEIPGRLFRQEEMEELNSRCSRCCRQPSHRERAQDRRDRGRGPYPAAQTPMWHSGPGRKPAQRRGDEPNGQNSPSLSNRHQDTGPSCPLAFGTLV